MTRLPFVLPEWTRVAWASDRAREVWEPRLARITRAWLEIERWAVVDGVKPSALQQVSPGELPDYVASAVAHGVIAIPLCQTPAGANAYAAAPSTSGPLVYRVVFTQPDLAADWPSAWATRDDRTIGRFLGFPVCCQEFFQQTWVADHRVDTTLAMVGDRDADVPPSLANILWRWMGVRLVSHLPCRFDCAASAAIADQLRQVGRDHGFTEEMDWTTAILSWPVEYTAWRGIAEIRTPILRVSTRTDATREKVTVRYLGTGYPDEGASGTAFPFRRRATTVPLTICRATPSAGDPHDNGFASEAALVAAHAAVLEAAGVTTPTTSVLDLGCGDGRLARALAGPAGYACGVELDPARAQLAAARLNEVIVGPIADVDRWRELKAARTLVMPGRLLEVPPDEAARIRAALTGRLVVVYAYGDWLERYGSLEALTRQAGLPWNPVTRRGDRHHGVEAALVMIGAA